MWWQQVDFLPSFVLHIWTWKTPVKCIKGSNRSHVHMQFKSLSLVYEPKHSLYRHQQWWRDFFFLFFLNSAQLRWWIITPRHRSSCSFSGERQPDALKQKQSGNLRLQSAASWLLSFTHMCCRAIMFWWESLILPGSLMSVVRCVDAQSNLKERQFKQTMMVCGFSNYKGLVWLCLDVLWCNDVTWSKTGIMSNRVISWQSLLSHVCFISTIVVSMHRKKS